MIGNSIRAVRERLGMEGKELATELGIHPSYLSRIENNKRNPSAELLSQIDRVAAGLGFPSNLVGMSEVNDPTARAVHAFMARDDVSVVRKESTRVLIDSIMKME